MELKIKIPVKPHVYNFLTTYYNTSTVYLDRRKACIIQAKLADMLSRPIRSYPAGRLSESYSHAITFVLTDWAIERGGFVLSDEKIINFNHFVDLFFKDKLFSVLDTLSEMPSLKVKRVIENYLDYYNLFEAGVKYDSLKKAYYRYRQDKYQQATENTYRGGSLPVLSFVPYTVA